MKKLAFVCAACAALELVAAPAAKLEPVAAGFPQWQGAVPRNYIRGREITASDLRHRAVVVIDVDDNANLHKQLLEASSLISLTGLVNLGFSGGNFETMELPRNVLVVVSCHGLLRNPDALKTALKTAGKEEVSLSYYSTAQVPFYEGLSLVGLDTEGKRPYIYVMGPTGTEPLAQGNLAAAGIKAAREAVGKAKKTMGAGSPWKQFYGTVDPEKVPALGAAIAKGKPLAQVAAAIAKDISSKDAEKATEAQIVYDALSQTRSDLLFRIRLEARACPHRAYYDFQQLVKFWPSEKKKLDDVMQMLKQQYPDADKLAKMFSKIMVWADPNFVCKNAGEAKKIVAELKKWKPLLAKLKEAKKKNGDADTIIQNGANILDMQVDELIESIPNRLPEK